MSEYIMSYTGEQLDEAIDKVLNEYIKPEGVINITEKDNNTEVDVTKYALAKVQIPIPTFITEEITINPTESTITKQPTVDGFSKVTVNPISSTYIGSKVTRKSEETFIPKKDVQQVIPSGRYLDGNQIIDKIPDDYIDLSKLTLHCSEGKYWTSSYSPSSDILLSNVSFDCGFKPKIFVVTNLSGIISNSTSTSKVHLLTSLFITDDDYNILLSFSSYLYYHTTNKLYMGSRSTSSSNTFAPTDTGVQGGNGTTVYFRGGNTYQVYAWG